MFAQIFKTNESVSSRDAARLRRQSRISREVVSSGQGMSTGILELGRQGMMISDNDPMPVPTKEWQDRIASQLANSSSASSSNYNRHFASHSSNFDISGARNPQRRRMDDMSMADRMRFDLNWKNMYTMSPPSGKIRQVHEVESTLICAAQTLMITLAPRMLQML
jgi:hypothetical protein